MQEPTTTIAPKRVVALAKMGKSQTFDKNEVLIKEGERSDANRHPFLGPRLPIMRQTGGELTRLLRTTPPFVKVTNAISFGP